MVISFENSSNNGSQMHHPNSAATYRFLLDGNDSNLVGRLEESTDAVTSFLASAWHNPLQPDRPWEWQGSKKPRFAARTLTTQVVRKTCRPRCWT
ncbi:MAG: hypothetical protein PHE53_11800 [Thermoguttaceae bacterium]|nr:hypothetical protein [Thermoguttaceae bacterium]